jgi:hypothetical protein
LPVPQRQSLLISPAIVDLVRELRGIVTHPILLPDGSILSRPGYDPASQLYLDCAELNLQIGETQDDARAALAELYEVVADFPFKDLAYRVSFAAAILTGITRHAHDGAVPMLLIDANQPRVGKGKLVKAIGIIAKGVPPHTQTWKGAQEMSAQLTAAIKAGTTMISIDNVKAPLSGAALENIITERYHSARIFRTHDEFKSQHNLEIIATGNGLKVTGDMAKRVYAIRLLTTLEQPQSRTDLQHPDLEGYVTANRARLLSAAFTILRAYHLAGRPLDNEILRTGSFESWTAVVCAPLVWLDERHPIDTQYPFATGEGTTYQTRLILITEWIKIFKTRPVLTRDLLQKHLPNHPQLRIAFIDWCRETGRNKNALDSAHKLGSLLREFAALPPIEGNQLVGTLDRTSTTQWSLVIGPDPATDTPNSVSGQGLASPTAPRARRPRR